MTEIPALIDLDYSHKVVEKLRAANKKYKQEDWRKEYGKHLFGIHTGKKTTVSDVAALRTAFIAAMNLKWLSEGNKGDEVDPDFISWHEVFDESKSIIDEDKISALVINKNMVGASISLETGVGAYRDYIHKGFEIWNGSSAHFVSYNYASPTLSKDKLTITVEECDPTTCYKSLLNVLTVFHLHDLVFSLSDKYPGVAIAKPNSIVSSLWYCMGIGFYKGYIIHCRYCGLPVPVIDGRSRGRKLFCNKICQDTYRQKVRRLGG